jgi:hypothetical protein
MIVSVFSYAHRLLFIGKGAIGGAETFKTAVPRYVVKLKNRTLGYYNLMYPVRIVLSLIIRGSLLSIIIATTQKFLHKYHKRGTLEWLFFSCHRTFVMVHKERPPVWLLCNQKNTSQIGVCHE